MHISPRARPLRPTPPVAAKRFLAMILLLASAIAQADVFEDDNEPTAAVWLGSDGTPQTHDFTGTNDQDWLMIYAEAPGTIEIETSALGPNCDTFLALFEGDGTTAIPGATDDNSGTDGGGASLLSHDFTVSGFYFVRITHAQGGSGAGTGYVVAVRQTVGGSATGQLIGTVFENGTSEGIGGAHVRLTNFGNARTVSDAQGAYFMAVPPGSYSLEASADGYDTAGITVGVQSGQTTGTNFFLNGSTPETGIDINGDDSVNAIDVQLVINAVLGLAIEGDGDVNNDTAIDAVDVQLVILGALGIG